MAKCVNFMTKKTIQYYFLCASPCLWPIFICSCECWHLPWDSFVSWRFTQPLSSDLVSAREIKELICIGKTFYSSSHKMYTYTITSCIAMATCITLHELSGVANNVAVICVYLQFASSCVCVTEKTIRSKWHNSRSTKLSNLNVSCVVDTLCNVSCVSDTLWAVQEYYIMKGITSDVNCLLGRVDNVGELLTLGVGYRMWPLLLVHLTI